jgi:DNA-directed RNA polymerase II subunit RPB1
MLPEIFKTARSRAACAAETVATTRRPLASTSVRQTITQETLMPPFLAVITPVDPSNRPDISPPGPQPGPWPPLFPTNPIAPGGPPPGPWVPAFPTNPIVLPPVDSVPPDQIWPVLPGHPIVLPPAPPVIWPTPPEKPPVEGQPPSIWGPTDPRPSNPIVIPPPVGTTPPAPGKPGAIVIWVPGYGYVIVPVGDQLPEGPVVTPHA